MLDYVREGDTLTEKGVTLVSHKESIDTDAPSGKLMLTVFAALSQPLSIQTLIAFSPRLPHREYGIAIRSQCFILGGSQE